MHIEEADIAQEAGTATEAIVILEPSNTAEATVASKHFTSEFEYHCHSCFTSGLGENCSPITSRYS
jgi:hypothetical protein